MQPVALWPCEWARWLSAGYWRSNLGNMKGSVCPKLIPVPVPYMFTRRTYTFMTVYFTPHKRIREVAQQTVAHFTCRPCIRSSNFARCAMVRWADARGNASWASVKWNNVTLCYHRLFYTPLKIDITWSDSVTTLSFWISFQLSQCFTMSLQRNTNLVHSQAPTAYTIMFILPRECKNNILRVQYCYQCCMGL